MTSPISSGPGELDDHPSVKRVRGVLAERGASGAIVVLGDHARTAPLAAEQLGVGVAQIANSLVFAVPDDTAPGGRRPLLVLTSGAHRVDTAKVAALVGAPRLDRADADFVRETTGFAIGGVAPVGHTSPVQTLVDTDLAQFDEVWAAGGHPRTVFPTTYDELVRITGGTPADVA
ncbi:YbaK/EbsC family protein [Kineosporia sp. A_224]|uniref:YbaK/EbsC family protein n=1 Tax=Kineosporia sp. A_224 TaxID=1962180 RepID=UPI001E4370A0|nr:YbaK/EbsC family protein [Kineosporia sp. A_224]